MRVAVRTEKNDVVIDVDGRAGPADLARLASAPGFSPVFSALSGTAPVRVYARVDLQGKTPLRLSGRSNLAGLSSSLPAPFAKSASEVWSTSFSWSPRPSGQGLVLSSAGHLEAALYFDDRKEGYALTSGFVGVGTPMGKAGDRLDLSVNVPRFSWDEWEPYWREIDRNSKAHADGHRIPWGTLRVKVAELLAHRMTIHNIDATLRHFGQNDWHLRLASDEVNGQAEFLDAGASPDKWTFKIDRAHLPEAAGDEIDTALDTSPAPGTLPSINLTIGDLRVGERRIGKVEFVTRNEIAPSGEGLAIIDRIAVTARGGSLLGQGVWRPESAADEVGTSHLTLEANFSDLGRILHDLRIRDVIRNAPGNVKLDLTFRGQPHMPQLNTLSGEVTAMLGSGQILQVEPGSGRLLGLLSMQHLMRRLTLDFRDVIGKGFTFDSVAAGGKGRDRGFPRHNPSFWRCRPRGRKARHGSARASEIQRRSARARAHASQPRRRGRDLRRAVVPQGRNLESDELDLSRARQLPGPRRRENAAGPHGKMRRFLLEFALSRFYCAHVYDP